MANLSKGKTKPYLQGLSRGESMLRFRAGFTLDKSKETSTKICYCVAYKGLPKKS